MAKLYVHGLIELQLVAVCKRKQKKTFVPVHEGCTMMYPMFRETSSKPCRSAWPGGNDAVPSPSTPWKSATVSLGALGYCAWMGLERKETWEL